MLYNVFRSHQRGYAIATIDLKPPRTLSISARKTYKRHAERIHAEGRYQQIDHDMLATYAETLELYLRFQRDIDEHGTLIQGRLKHEMVRNPSLMGLSQARADLIRLARAVPLVHPHPDTEGQALLDEIGDFDWPE